MRREARMIVLRPAYRRFIRSVVSRMRAPREVAQRLAMDLRRRLEEAEAGGATPDEAMAALGDPTDIAAALMSEHGLRPRPDLRRVLPAASAALGIVVLATAGLITWSNARADALPALQPIGEIQPHGTVAGAHILVSADLRGDGHPMVVGMQQVGAISQLRAWTLAADGGVALADTLDLPAAYGQIVAARFLPGAADQVAVTVGPDVDLVGWRSGHLAVLTTVALPAAIGDPVAAAGTGGGLASLYGLSFAAPQMTVLHRLAWNGSAFAAVASQALQPPQPPVGNVTLAAGDAGGRPYVAVIHSSVFMGSVCTGAPAPGEVLDGLTLQTVWQGTLGQNDAQGLDPPDGGLEIADHPNPFGEPAALQRWTGTSWQQVGTFACRGWLLGLDATGRPLLGAGTTLERTELTGADSITAAWPYHDGEFPLQSGQSSLVTQGPFIVVATPQWLQVARFAGSALNAVWSGTDSSTVQGLSLRPTGGRWQLLDQAGNVLAPSGDSWTWAGVPAAAAAGPPGPSDWLPFCGTSVQPRLGQTGGRNRLQLLAPGGAVVASWTEFPHAIRTSTVFVVPLGPRRCDVGLIFQRTAQSDAELQIMRLVRGALLPVGRTVLPPPPPQAQYGVEAVLPGSGKAQIVLQATSAIFVNGRPPVPTYLSFVWNGRRLTTAASPAIPAGTATFATPVQAGGQWVVAGLAESGALFSFFGLDNLEAQADQGPRSPVQLVLGRLQRSGRIAWRSVPLPTSEPGLVTLLPVPDGSGRILLTVAGRTFVYRFR